MRVAFLTNLIPPYHKPLYRLLSRAYEFRLFLSTAMEANRPWFPEWEGLDVVVQKGLTLRQSWRHPSGFQEPLSVHFPLDTIAQLKKFQPNVIVSAEMGFRTLLACVYARLHPPCRLFIWSEVTPATEQGRGKFRQLLRRFLAKHAAGFLALGPDGARYIHSLGVPHDKIFKIAYSTNVAPFSEIPLERAGNTAMRLLFAGQLISRKGLLPFLKTLSTWAGRHPGQPIEFTLAGDGPERVNLSAIPLPSNVKLIFIGNVQYEQMPALYSASSIFVLPTLADTWAVVINEALLSGLPVLGSRYSQAVAEMVNDGETGWTFRPDDGDDVYRAIDRALSTSEAALHEMRAQCRRAALEVTPDKTAAVMEHAFRAIT